MPLIFSTVQKPRGRGKIERFFESLAQVCLSRLPGYGRPPSAQEAVLTLPQLTGAARSGARTTSSIASSIVGSQIIGGA